MNAEYVQAHVDCGCQTCSTHCQIYSAGASLYREPIKNRRKIVGNSKLKRADYISRSTRISSEFNGGSQCSRGIVS